MATKERPTGRKCPHSERDQQRDFLALFGSSEQEAEDRESQGGHRRRVGTRPNTRSPAASSQVRVAAEALRGAQQYLAGRVEGGQPRAASRSVVRARLDCLAEFRGSCRFGA